MSENRAFSATKFLETLGPRPKISRPFFFVLWRVRLGLASRWLWFGFGLGSLWVRLGFAWVCFGSGLLRFGLALGWAGPGWGSLWVGLKSYQEFL